MALLGKLHEFNPDSEELSVYLQRVEIYFVVNDVEEAKKVPVLLNCIGGTTYGLLRSLLAPDSPMSKSYAEIREVTLPFRAEAGNYRRAVQVS